MTLSSIDSKNVLINFEKGEFSMISVSFESMSCDDGVISTSGVGKQNLEFKELSFQNISVLSDSLFSLGPRQQPTESKLNQISPPPHFSLSTSSFTNITTDSSSTVLFKSKYPGAQVKVTVYNVTDVSSDVKMGILIEIMAADNVVMEVCSFVWKDEREIENKLTDLEICSWD
jgi:hypothetical protein